MRRPFDGEISLSQHFKEHPENYTQYGLQGHNGLDYATPKGTPILAPHAGKVTEANFDPTGYGNYVKIENDKEGSLLAHLDKIEVQIGFEVKEGDRVGLSGNTGYVLPKPSPQSPDNGSHLHWGYFTKPRVRTNGFNGYIDQEPILTAYLNGHSFKYKVGDIIEPSIDLPVGESPGNEKFEYGKVGPSFPAKIVGLRHIYYNISQEHIGGGTGWVDSKLVDATPEYKAEPVNPSSPKTYSEEQYNSLLEERNAALTLAKDNLDKCTDVNILYQGFVALGYTRADQITSLIQEKDAKFIDINKQLVQVLERNQLLAKMVQDKDKEDATAIDEGIKAQQEAADLKDTVSQISKAAGTKPNVFDIVNHIFTLKEYAENYFKRKKEDEKAVKKTGKKKKEVKSDPDSNWLLKVLGLQEGSDTT